MTRDDIVKMAHEAGLVMPTAGITENQWKSLEIFADLVALAERKRTWLPADWLDYEKNIAAMEREACAKVCEKVGEHQPITPRHCAAAIRARRN